MQVCGCENIEHANPCDCVNHKDEWSRDRIYEGKSNSSLNSGKGHEEEEKPTSFWGNAQEWYHNIEHPYLRDCMNPWFITHWERES